MNDETDQKTSGTARREVMRAVTTAAAIGASVSLAACGSGDSGSDNAGSSGGGDGQGGAASTGPVTIAASKVPVGGGYIDASSQAVITQPSSGNYRAFSAICTHEGCPVTSVSHGKITCPCHGSQFSIKDGSVVSGPAQSPLPAKKVTASGGNLTVG